MQGGTFGNGCAKRRSKPSNQRSRLSDSCTLSCPHPARSIHRAPSHRPVSRSSQPALLISAHAHGLRRPRSGGASSGGANSAAAAAGSAAAGPAAVVPVARPLVDDRVNGQRLVNAGGRRELAARRTRRAAAAALVPAGRESKRGPANNCPRRPKRRHGQSGCEGGGGEGNGAASSASRKGSSLTRP